MRYVYTAGNYREFRGYVFTHGKPVTITDRGTLEAISRERDFKEWSDEEAEAEAPAEAGPQVLRACPKCGETFGRGLTMHTRFCKG